MTRMGATRESVSLVKKVGFFFVLNAKGLHTRPATELVRCATRFRAAISLSYRGERVNAKSILGVLMLAAEERAKVMVEAVGSDASDAVEAILALASNCFNTGY